MLHTWDSGVRNKTWVLDAHLEHGEYKILFHLFKSYDLT